MGLLVVAAAIVAAIMQDRAERRKTP